MATGLTAVDLEATGLKETGVALEVREEKASGQLQAEDLVTGQSIGMETGEKAVTDRIEAETEEKEATALTIEAQAQEETTAKERKTQKGRLKSREEKQGTVRTFGNLTEAAHRREESSFLRNPPTGIKEKVKQCFTSERRRKSCAFWESL